jgi:hypothetical protein
LRCHLWLTFSIADQVVVHRQAATRAADRMVKGFGPEVLIVLLSAPVTWGRGQPC